MINTASLFRLVIVLTTIWNLLPGTAFAGPELPATMGTVSIPAQEWPLHPGPREIAVHVRYPGAGAKIEGVRESTGIMLSLHNWGGTASGGSADPGTLANLYNVIAVGVDYLQSGAQASKKDPEPYDFGYLQALDALRALHFVISDLQRRGIKFDSTRLFTTGGSGGGNVSLMANKFAPRTFTAVIDMCGMKRLTDDIAFNLPGGSSLNARYVRDPQSPYYLSPDRQELHDLGNPAHLAVMKQLGTTAKIFTVHGVEDAICPGADEYAVNMTAAGLDFTYVRVTKEILDGKIFTSSGHPLGNRTAIVTKVAEESLKSLHRTGPTEVERK
ncbi:MAG: prolyl oligopeptidase family serine peptidase, partial [Verrucomicrobiales bacterium]